MSLLNLLSSIFLPSFGNLGGSANADWLSKIIAGLIGFVGDVGIGIILFTVILKLITLPLDIYSRASMKKNNLKMEMMKDDLEKLKKQYKNNEQLYQQKMMSLYKKNGYNAFSACLPTIITLVFFIVVIGAFNKYSRIADREVFVDMGKAYDLCLDSFVEKDENGNNTGALIKSEDSQTYLLNLNKALSEKGFEIYFNGYKVGEVNTETSKYTLNFEEFKKSGNSLLTAYPTLAGYLKNGEFNYENAELLNRVEVDFHTFIINQLGLNQTQIDSLKNSGIIKVSQINGQTLYSISDKAALDSKHNSEYIETVDGNVVIKYSQIANHVDMKETLQQKSESFVCEKAITLIGEDYLLSEIKSKARTASAKAYEENKSTSVIFPWIKNLWVVDSPFNRALPTIKDLETSIGAENMGSLKDESVYEELTYNLSAYKQTGFGKGNGWFILVALSILTMVGSTLIMNKQQKTQMQLSSVDGENSTAASTQKMMTWIMPIMFGIFAFIYSAAFSIYMITSSLLSTGFTMLINFFVEKSFKNKIVKEKEEKNEKIKYGKRRD
ncbi:MAG: YidC/Oxa1 family membrane protein insertase [Clostridia bacterium]|nr:YidC/Oxa1 family membrane protein insertase [Clostridia bacterium]